MERVVGGGRLVADGGGGGGVVVKRMVKGILRGKIDFCNFFNTKM